MVTFADLINEKNEQIVCGLYVARPPVVSYSNFYFILVKSFIV